MLFAQQTLHITSTTLQRMFLLKPDAVVNQILFYCLFRAAEDHGVLVHSVFVASTHVHMVVTDVRGEVSEFMHWFSMMTAKNLIAYYEKQYPEMYLESIWSKQPYNAPVLANANAVIKAIAYDVTNPEKDGLVRDFRDWPGVCSRPHDWTQPARKVKRPEGLAFSRRDTEHREVTVKFTVPPALCDRSLQLAVDDVNAAIRDNTKSIRKEFELEGRTWLGEEGVLAVSPFDSPNTPRSKGKRVPNFACGGDEALMKACLTLLRLFRHAYHECMQRYLAGDHTAVFPAGTYLMRQRHHVACEELRPPWCVAV
jgi:putative transposase